VVGRVRAGPHEIPASLYEDSVAVLGDDLLGIPDDRLREVLRTIVFRWPMTSSLPVRGRRQAPSRGCRRWDRLHHVRGEQGRNRSAPGSLVKAVITPHHLPGFTTDDRTRRQLWAKV
jgi:hypothetical protein